MSTCPDYKKKTIPKQIRDMVWNVNIGETVASSKCKCCCQNEISMQNFECGHIIAEARGGSNDVSNMKPICGPCNRSMGIRNMDEYRRMYGLDGSFYQIDKSITSDSFSWSFFTKPILIDACEFYGISKNGLKDEIIENLSPLDPIPFVQFMLMSSFDVPTLKSILDGMNIRYADDCHKGILSELITSNGNSIYNFIEMDGEFFGLKSGKNKKTCETKLSTPVKMKQDKTEPLDPSNWNKLTVDQLKLACSFFDLKKTGTKSILIESLSSKNIDLFVRSLKGADLLEIRGKLYKK